MVTPAWRIEQRKRRNEEENSAERDGARPDEVERLAVSHRLGDRVYDDRQISADVVHQEEEESDARGANARVANLKKRILYFLKLNLYTWSSAIRNIFCYLKIMLHFTSDKSIKANLVSDFQ